MGEERKHFSRHPRTLESCLKPSTRVVCCLFSRRCFFFHAKLRSSSMFPSLPLPRRNARRRRRRRPIFSLRSNDAMMMMMMMMMMRQFAFQSLSRHRHRAVVVVHRANSRCPHPTTTTTTTMRRTFASSLCSRDGAVDADSKTPTSCAFALQ